VRPLDALVLLPTTMPSEIAELLLAFRAHGFASTINLSRNSSNVGLCFCLEHSTDNFLNLLRARNSAFFSSTKYSKLPMWTFRAQIASYTAFAACSLVLLIFSLSQTTQHPTENETN
jgi:hypothetical protein